MDKLSLRIYLAMEDLRYEWDQYRRSPRDLDIDPDPVTVQLLRLTMLTSHLNGEQRYAHRDVTTSTVRWLHQAERYSLAAEMEHMLELYREADKLVERDLA